jgi:peptidoglycan L-alanyl-D-glutamate endopeptidase CwlK
MTFALSKRSTDNLIGVNPKLDAVVRRAIAITKIDFAVTEGVRSVERQRELVADGASQTMDSKHITGAAVDLVAYLGGRISWELNLYDDLAAAMRQAAIEQGVALRWGAAWNIPDICKWEGTMEEAMNYYVDARRKEGRRLFIDAPHFEMV